VHPRAERLRIVVLGRLVRRKGVDEVIAALRRLPGVELLVAGGPDGSGEHSAALHRDPDAQRLRQAAAAAGVADRVRLLGAVARPDVPALLRSADAVVCVPWYEPFGIVPLEAMACGRPVVASAVGGIQDTVVDQVTGLLVPPCRPDAVAAALRTLLATPTRALAFGIAGRDRVLARYGWDRIADCTLAVYEEVLAERAGRPAPDRMDDVLHPGRTRRAAPTSSPRCWPRTSTGSTEPSPRCRPPRPPWHAGARTSGSGCSPGTGCSPRATGAALRKRST
jgi:D-inositol-3-phosphate glycosyltransferase